MSLSVIVPASNEAGWIGPCLAALAQSRGIGGQVIVAANGCRDDTVDQARALGPTLAGGGWDLTVLDLPDPGKPGALNAADAVCTGQVRVYLDADVMVSAELMAQLAFALRTDAPRYASGTPRVLARGALTRAYARFWQRLPFVAQGVPGFGVFAVNAAGRARWGAFPSIISDDTYVRLQFSPAERLSVPAAYDWPMVEGFMRLVRVRRRQDQGVAEIAKLYPELMVNEAKARPGLRWLIGQALRDPLAFGAYAAVSLAVRAGMGAQSGWVRGR